MKFVFVCLMVIGAVAGSRDKRGIISAGWPLGVAVGLSTPGAVAVGPSHTGSVAVGPSHTGYVAVGPSHTGSVAVGPSNDGAVFVGPSSYGGVWAPAAPFIAPALAYGAHGAFLGAPAGVLGLNGLHG